ncbi:ribosome maturation factor RimP [Brockia lithotrophica]|uniref:ribosome maturation factor RimP n=1 Tax=Brockia lithotrophica TaxID=933949 RepID=UPI0011C351EF|nr:ribosome maturation factor RimP [Brockia lithotrophica]
MRDDRLRSSEERERELEHLVESIVGDMGYVLVDVAEVRERANLVVRVAVDRPEGGITLGEIERISLALGDALDVASLYDHPYLLDVTSPGLDRELRTDREFRWAEGKPIRLITREPLEGANVWEGILRVGADPLVVEVEGRQVEIPRRLVKRARLNIPL